MNMDLYVVRLELQIAHQWAQQGNIDRAILHIELGEKYLEEVIEKYERRAKETPPIHYWQHGETGRVCVTALQPSEEWYEITRAQYIMRTYQL